MPLTSNDPQDDGTTSENTGQKRPNALELGPRKKAYVADFLMQIPPNL